MARTEIIQPRATSFCGVRPLKASRQQRETQALLETLRDISSHLDLDRVLESIVERANALIGSDCTSLALKVEGEDEVQMRVAVGFTELLPIRLKLGEGLMGLVAQKRQPVFVPDYLGDPLLVHTVDQNADREGIRAALGVPLMVDDKVIGVLAVANRSSTPFTPDNATLLSSLANSAAIAIENARLFQSEREKVLQLTELNAQVRAQHNLLKRAVVIHDQLTEMVLEDRGTDAIAERLAALVDNPVMVEDRFFRMVACSEGAFGSDGQRRNSAAVQGTPREALEHPWMKEQLKLLAQERRPMHLPPRPELGTSESRVIAPIVVGKEVLGYLSVLEYNRQLEEFDFLAVEHGATIFALEMMKQRIAFGVEQQLKGDFLDALISGTYHSPKSIGDRAIYLGYDLSGAQTIMIVEIDDLPEVVNRYQGDEKLLLSFKKRLLGVVSGVLQRRGIRSLMAIKGDSVLIVLPAVVQSNGTSKDARSVADLVRGEVTRELSGTTVLIGVGRVCDDLSDYSRSFDEARKALDIAKHLGLKDRVVTLDELGAHWLLFQVQDKAELRKFAQRILGSLLEYDARHNGQFVTTLDAYLQNNCSIQHTAEALFVHVNTLTYRMRRIQEVGKIDLANAEHRLNAMLAIKIIKVSSSLQAG